MIKNENYRIRNIYEYEIYTIYTNIYSSFFPYMRVRHLCVYTFINDNLYAGLIGLS